MPRRAVSRKLPACTRRLACDAVVTLSAWSPRPCWTSDARALSGACEVAKPLSSLGDACELAEGGLLLAHSVSTVGKTSRYKSSTDRRPSHHLVTA